jgi:hypothetical protein
MPVCPPLLYSLLIAFVVVVVVVLSFVVLPRLVATTTAFVEKLGNVGVSSRLCHGLLQRKLMETPLTYQELLDFEW